MKTRWNFSMPRSAAPILDPEISVMGEEDVVLHLVGEHGPVPAARLELDASADSG